MCVWEYLFICLFEKTYIKVNFFFSVLYIELFINTFVFEKKTKTLINMAYLVRGQNTYLASPFVLFA
jgi:hypothetical protein